MECVKGYNIYINSYKINDIEIINRVYEEAKNGGRHHGMYSNRKILNDKAILRAIKGYTKQVEVHKNKIKYPQKYAKDWNQRNQLAKLGLINKWKKDLTRNQELAILMKAIAKERGL